MTHTYTHTAASIAPPPSLPVLPTRAPLILSSRGTSALAAPLSTPAHAPLPTQVSSDLDQLRLTTREALLSRTLSHPHLVQTYALSISQLTAEDLAPETYAPPPRVAGAAGGRGYGGGCGGDSFGPGAGISTAANAVSVCVCVCT